MKTEPLIGADFGEKLPAHRAFRVVLQRAHKGVESTAIGVRYDIDVPAVEQVVMAHSMSVIDGAIVFYSWRVEELMGQPTVIQYCTDAFHAWDEAHEIQMPAVQDKRAH